MAQVTTQAGEPTDEARALYGLAPEEFTAARDALVRRLKKEGRADEAAAVAKMRRPSRTAWALDQLARREPALVAEVLRAGKRLRDTMAASEGRAVLDTAQADERRALSDAVTRALELLTDARATTGDTAAVQMAETLRAAILDPDVESRLVAGTLDSDVSAPGFDVLAARPAEGQAVVGAGAGSSSRSDRAGAAKEQRRLQALRQRREREARQARGRADDAVAKAEAAEDKAHELRRRAEELVAAAAEAERAVEEVDDE
jgi:hypothetical protein